MSQLDLKTTLELLVKVFVDQMIASGGDGDGIWYSKFYNVHDDLEPIFDKYLELMNFFKWGGVKEYDNNGKTIIYHAGQESLIITNLKELYDGTPDWVQMKIIF